MYIHTSYILCNNFLVNSLMFYINCMLNWLHYFVCLYTYVNLYERISTILQWYYVEKEHYVFENSINFIWFKYIICRFFHKYFLFYYIYKTALFFNNKKAKIWHKYSTSCFQDILYQSQGVWELEPHQMTSQTTKWKKNFKILGVNR